MDDMTCGTCGRTWNDAATPTPAGRCPFEHLHEYEREEATTPTHAELLAELADARSLILEFAVTCREEEYTDTDDAWELLGKLYAIGNPRTATLDDDTEEAMEEADLATWIDRDELVARYIDAILPTVRAFYEPDGQIDAPARREAWNDWTDHLCKEGEMPESQYNDGDGLPDWLEERNP